MTEYHVHFVRDEALPPGTDWALTRSEEYDRIRCFLKQSAISQEVLAQAWAGYRRLAARPPTPVPLSA